MKKIFFLLLICSSSSALFAQAGSKEASIRKFLEITGAAEIGVETMKQIISSFQVSVPAAGEKFWKDFEKEVKPQDLVELMVPIYDKFYTNEEIDALIRFYETPLGKKVIRVSIPIMKESMTIGQEWGKQIGEKIIRRLKESGYTRQGE